MMDQDARLKEIHDIMMARAELATANIQISVRPIRRPVTIHDDIMSFRDFKLHDHLKENERRYAVQREFDSLIMPSFSDVEFEGFTPVNNVLCRERTDPLVLEALDIVMRKKSATENQLMKAWKINWLRDLDEFYRRIDNIKISENLELLAANTPIHTV